MARYANKADLRPCEHVSFHECLREVIPTTSKGSELSIGIQPRLVPHWNSKNQTFVSELKSYGDDEISATHHNQPQLDIRPGLGAFGAKETSRRKLSQASSLLSSLNKKYHLRIDHLNGNLLLEDHEKKDEATNPSVVWKAAVMETDAPTVSWMKTDKLVRSSLIIRDGAVIFEREVANNRGDGKAICDTIQRSCRFEVWSSDRETSSTAILALSDTGSLSLINKKTQRTSWTAAEDITWSACPSRIPSKFRLYQGETICSPNNGHRLGLQGDGMFLWKASDVDKDGAASASKRIPLAIVDPSTPGQLVAQMQGDGNFVLLRMNGDDGPVVVWSSKTRSVETMGSHVELFDDGRVGVVNLEDDAVTYMAAESDNSGDPSSELKKSSSVLSAGESLGCGNSISSPTDDSSDDPCSYYFGLSNDCVLELRCIDDAGKSSVLWSLDESNSSGKRSNLIMQDDGNLVLYGSSMTDALWATNTLASSANLSINRNGFVQIKNRDEEILWYLSRDGMVQPRNVLGSDEHMSMEERICSPRGTFCFGIHEDNHDLRLWRVPEDTENNGEGGDESSSIIFATKSGSLSDLDAALIMQDDGNLVLRTKSDVLWTSESHGDANHGSELFVLDYGTAEIRNQQGIAIRSFALKNNVGGTCSRWLFGEEWLRDDKNSICSPNGQYKLRRSPENQDLVVFDKVGNLVWNAGIESNGDTGIYLQSDGNLIYEDKERNILWRSGVTARSSNGVGLTVTDDGVVMIFDFGGTLIWSSDDIKSVSVGGKKGTDDTNTLSSLYLPGCGCADALYPGQLLNLTTNDLSLCSPGATHRFGFDSETGDLSIWQKDKKVWSRGLFQKEAHRTVELTHGGNLVVREGRVVVIDTGTDSDTANAGSFMSIGDDGVVRLKNSKGRETVLFNPLLPGSPPEDKSLIAGKSTSTEVIDSSSLKGKILTGYQGWFTTPCDDGLKRWHHWSNRAIPSDQTVTVDMWPDVDEYDADELCETDFRLQDDMKASLFSSYNPKTVDRHIKWMSDYGIDGAVVQRFIADIRVFRQMRDQVLKNVQISSERHGRIFANMYDITGLEPSPSILEDIMNDWKHLVDGLKVTESPRYLRSNDLPVLGVYFGKATKSPLSAKETSTLIDWLQNNPEKRYRATVLGAGLGKDWRIKSSPDWRAAYQKLDVISPWTVGVYDNEDAYDQHYEKYQASDVKFCHRNGQDYLPVVFPGFSAKQIMDGKAMNEIPRNGGEFLWRQLFQTARSGAGMVYVAMFDEYDEGTAIMKAAATKNDVPTNGEFVAFDVDENYQSIPNDWYLRLVGEATKLFRKDAKHFPDTIPINASKE